MKSRIDDNLIVDETLYFQFAFNLRDEVFD